MITILGILFSLFFLMCIILVWLFMAIVGFSIMVLLSKHCIPVRNFSGLFYLFDKELDGPYFGDYKLERFKEDIIRSLFAGPIMWVMVFICLGVFLVSNIIDFTSNIYEKISKIMNLRFDLNYNIQRLIAFITR